MKTDWLKLYMSFLHKTSYISVCSKTLYIIYIYIYIRFLYIYIYTHHTYIYWDVYIYIQHIYIYNICYCCYLWNCEGIGHGLFSSIMVSTLQRCISNPVRRLRWSFFRKYFTAKVHNLFLQKSPFWMFDWVFHALLRWCI